jgi:hypothetical protein
MHLQELKDLSLHLHDSSNHSESLYVTPSGEARFPVLRSIQITGNGRACIEVLDSLEGQQVELSSAKFNVLDEVELHRILLKMSQCVSPNAFRTLEVIIGSGIPRNTLGSAKAPEKIIDGSNLSPLAKYSLQDLHIEAHKMILLDNESLLSLATGWPDLRRLVLRNPYPAMTSTATLLMLLERCPSLNTFGTSLSAINVVECGRLARNLYHPNLVTLALEPDHDLAGQLERRQVAYDLTEVLSSTAPNLATTLIAEKDASNEQYYSQWELVNDGITSSVFQQFGEADDALPT